VQGEWKRDSKYGHQLRAYDYVETAPATLTGLENYLASGLVKGIGPVAARQIVLHFKVGPKAPALGLFLLSSQPYRKLSSTRRT
jgi:ATP-dependent exoDNAse (exonuclease V) alpha subunit